MARMKDEFCTRKVETGVDLVGRAFNNLKRLPELALLLTIMFSSISPHDKEEFDYVEGVD